MTRLSVNINKIATIRNARGGNVPNVVKTAIDCQKFGAEGITVHPRPDERHITRKDAIELKEVITTEYNIEGYPSRRFLDLIAEIKPDQVTLVPDPPDAITSNAGWNTIKNVDFLKDVVDEIKSYGARSSVFIDPNISMIEKAPDTGADRVELYTEPYATNFPLNKEKAISPYVEAAKMAQSLDLGINAGHDLSLENLKFFIEQIPFVDEVSIGHALISDALYIGLEKAVQQYLLQLK